jgi:hypothetical protein
MTSHTKARRNGVLGLLAAVGLFFVVQWFREDTTLVSGTRPTVPHPELFEQAIACTGRGRALENGRRSEELALLRADRYPYDSRDGVRAVQHYREAESCYLRAGADAEAARIHRASAVLMARVNTDYAAARLNLANALEQERWLDALSEIRRLLLLTQHLRRNEYVEWLNQTIGRVAARASTAP